MDYSEIEKKARLGAFSTLDMEIFIPVVQAIPKNGVYVEIGVDKGKSLSVARMITDPSVKVVGVDIQEDPRVEGTEFIQSDSAEAGRGWKEKIDVIFIDGDHSYEGCSQDINAWYPHMKESGIMLFHDCDETSPGVLQAVAEFVNTHKVDKFELFKRTDKNTSMCKLQL